MKIFDISRTVGIFWRNFVLLRIYLGNILTLSCFTFYNMGMNSVDRFNYHLQTPDHVSPRKCWYLLFFSVSWHGMMLWPALKKLLKREGKKFSKNLSSYEMIFGETTFFSIIKLVFGGKREFYLFYYNAALKYRVLFK